MESYRYQVFFDDNKQYRYFATRVQLLRFMLSMGLKADNPTFAVWVDAGPVTLADGRQIGRKFAPQENWNLRENAVYDQLMAELEQLEAAEAATAGR